MRKCIFHLFTSYSFEDFTYGRKIGKKQTVSNIIKNRLIRLEEKRQQRKTLKTLYEKKAYSICGERDNIFVEKVAEKQQTINRLPMSNKYTEEEIFDIEIEYKRQNSHGPLNYYLSKQEQLERNQKIQINLIEFTAADKELISQSKTISAALSDARS